MDEKDDTTPFPREPWQRLLDDAEGGPPETTDARIRAAARRDLAPRFHRWWLPASLAASFVLAVFVVQSQFGTLRVPVTRESDRGAGGTLEARIIDREEATEARPPGAAPSSQGKRQAEPRAEDEADVYGYQESELAADSAGAGPMVGGPERELREAIERPQDSAAAATTREPQVMDLPPPAPAPPAVADPKPEGARNTGVTGSRKRSPETAEAQLSTTLIKPPPFEKTPETWYAFIEKLRAQGKVEEAERQLERLEKAHPGWIARHLEEESRR